MEGYYRSLHTKDQLVSAIEIVLAMCPEMRFGQILQIVFGDEDTWNIYDEEYSDRLLDFALARYDEWR